jgi:type I restriction enzyme S subunit
LRRTSTKIAEQYARSTLKASDIILTIVGTIGKVAEVPAELEGANITQSSCRIRADRALVEPTYVRRFLRSPSATAQYEAKRLGTAVPRLNIADIRQFELPLPPAAEQRRIVAKLDALTARIARARAELDRVPVLAQRLRNNALASSLQCAGAPRARLGDILQDIRYGTAQKCDYGAGAWPVLRIPNVQRGSIDLSDIKSADFDDREVQKLSLLEGDVLVIRSNGSLDLVGRSAVVTREAAGMLYAGYLIRLRPDTKKIIPSFLHHFLASPDVRSLLTGAAKSTSGVNNVNSQQLQALSVPLPPISVQERAVAAIHSTFARADRLEAEAARARALIDRLESAILANAFRGELVPQDPNDEPASVLLDRIRAERAAAPKAKRGRRAKADAR